MNDSRPKISIGFPVYNGERYLREAVDSLLAQTFGDFELILCDNASTDSTAQICQDYAARDPRVRYHRHASNIGATANFNAAFELSRGPFFKWAAADDRHAPRYLELTLAVLEADASAVLAYSKTQLMDERGAPLDSRLVNTPLGTHLSSPSQRFRGALREEWCVAIFGVMRADVLQRTGLHRNFYSSDKVLLAELSLRGKFQRVEETLFFRRCHEEQSASMSSRARARWAVPGAALTIPFQARAFASYFAVTTTAPISLGQRLRCYASAAGMLLSADKWHKLLVPGPYNYFGIDPFPRRKECTL
jgi:glycosyltransferase involved in cell wall biosynthesis